MGEKVFEIHFNTLADVRIEEDAAVVEGYDSLDKLKFGQKKCRIPSNPGPGDRIVFQRGDKEQFICGKFFPLSDRYRNSYACLGKWILSKSAELK